MQVTWQERSLSSNWSFQLFQHSNPAPRNPSKRRNCWVTSGSTWFIGGAIQGHGLSSEITNLHLCVVAEFQTQWAIFDPQSQIAIDLPWWLHVGGRHLWAIAMYREAWEVWEFRTHQIVLQTELMGLQHELRTMPTYVKAFFWRRLGNSVLQGWKRCRKCFSSKTKRLSSASP